MTSNRSHWSLAFTLLLSAACGAPKTPENAGKPASRAAALTTNPLSVFVGYADNLRPSPNFPVPWKGAPNTNFIGGCNDVDAGAIRLDNAGSTPLVIDSVVVDMQRPGPVFNLWGSFSVP